MKKFKILDVNIDCLCFQESLTEIQEIILNCKQRFIVTPNVDHLVMLQSDIKFKEIYENASLVLPDGVPIIWASKILGGGLTERCAGADLFVKICEIAFLCNKKIFLLGGTNNSEIIAGDKLKAKFVGLEIASYCPPIGFENNKSETDKIINSINNFKTDILFVFVGSPKSEKWIYNNINRMNISIACPFGAALDYFAGTKKRAPVLTQKYGLEWFWRLILEPRRLWKRYLIGNVFFLLIVIKEYIKNKVRA